MDRRSFQRASPSGLLPQSVLQLRACYYLNKKRCPRRAPQAHVMSANLLCCSLLSCSPTRLQVTLTAAIQVDSFRRTSAQWHPGGIASINQLPHSGGARARARRGRDVPHLRMRARPRTHRSQIGLGLVHPIQMATSPRGDACLSVSRREPPLGESRWLRLSHPPSHGGGSLGDLPSSCARTLP